MLRDGKYTQNTMKSILCIIVNNDKSLLLLQCHPHGIGHFADCVTILKYKNKNQRGSRNLYNANYTKYGYFVIILSKRHQHTK